ncbi:DNA repair protein RecO [Mesomycoplasma molare]|uniref:DNA repair protein RecO n=1 Tax=Mesomycoplasma molare TaxID=171288 RepID=A0ABY5TY66_9BACT|nr:DNA repair protein RecO [Mesomycoplasma molare]UWD34461.1 DNA repair protein RecO [Mesomycoplasma molare]
MSTTLIKGIVIDYKEYENNDAIVKILTTKKVISFLAKGVRKPLSKNRNSLLLLTIGEYELFLSRLNNSMSKLKKGNIIENFNFLDKKNIYEEFLEIMRYIKILEYSNKEFFDLLEYSLKIAKNNNIFFIKTYILFKILTFLGYKQTADKCIECYSNKNLNDFKIFSGGMTCKIHTQNASYKSIEDLKTFYYLSHSLEIYLKFANVKSNYTIYKEIKEFINENII